MGGPAGVAAGFRRLDRPHRRAPPHHRPSLFVPPGIVAALGNAVENIILAPQRIFRSCLSPAPRRTCGARRVSAGGAVFRQR
jgi:hypothetical protein